MGVANDIEVRLPLLHQRPDPVIAAMRWERGDMICRTPPMLVRW